jgi:hypothetical protein
MLLLVQLQGGIAQKQQHHLKYFRLLLQLQPCLLLQLQLLLFLLLLLLPLLLLLLTFQIFELLHQACCKGYCWRNHMGWHCSAWNFSLAAAGAAAAGCSCV